MKVCRLMSAAKTGVAEYYMQYGIFPATNYDAGLVEPHQIYGNHVASITVSEGGVITTLYKENENFRELGIGNYTVIIKPLPNETGISWDCTLGTMPDKYRPSNCRTQ